MAKARDKLPFVELSSAFKKKADMELERLREMVAKNLKEEMIGLLEDEIHADLLITNGTVSVWAHKCILQARCRHLWREGWLTRTLDADTDSDVSCLEMSGLNGEQLMQFVRQLYSVSDGALLLEEYLDCMPIDKQNSSLLERRFDSMTCDDSRQSEVDGDSVLCLLVNTPETQKDSGVPRTVSNGKENTLNNRENRAQEHLALSVVESENFNNDNEITIKNIFENQVMVAESKIVNLESNSLSLASKPVERNTFSLPHDPTESKTAHAANIMSHSEGKAAHMVHKSALTESKVVLAHCEIAHTEHEDAHSESQTGHMECDSTCTESKVVLAHCEIAHTEREDAHSESQTGHIECDSTCTESKAEQGEEHSATLSGHSEDCQSLLPSSSCDRITKLSDHQTQAVGRVDHHIEAVGLVDHHIEAVTTVDHHIEAVTPADHHTEAVTTVDHHIEAVGFVDHHIEAVTTVDHHIEAVTTVDHHIEAVTPTDHHIEAVTTVDHHIEAVVPVNHHIEAVMTVDHDTKGAIPVSHQTEAAIPRDYHTKAVESVNHKVHTGALKSVNHQVHTDAVEAEAVVPINQVHTKTLETINLKAQPVVCSGEGLVRPNCADEVFDIGCEVKEMHDLANSLEEAKIVSLASGVRGTSEDSCVGEHLLSSGSSEVVHGTSEAVHGTSETVHGTSEAVHGTSETVHGTSEAVHGTSEAVHGTSETVHGTSEGVHGTSETVHGTSEAVHGTSETVHGTSEAVHGTSETVHGTSEAVHGTSETVHGNTDKEDPGNGAGAHMSKTQVESVVASHEKVSVLDVVVADQDAKQYKTCSPLGRDLLNMYFHQDNCDCCLSVNGVHFMAHKCLLSARCEYFLAMFSGQWSESQMATVNLEAVSPQAVRQLLLFLYGGVVNLCEQSDLKDLFVIADMYGVLTFRAMLTFYVKKDLCHFFHKPCPACVTTTPEALLLCHTFHLEDLQARCLKWMAKYFTKIWPTKAFSALEDSIHQLCLESILSQMTASNVLDIIIECNKLISSLPRIKWTETILYLVTRLMDSAIEFTSSHFVDVLKTKEFLLWAKVASWKASVLEEIFDSVINSLPVDTACLVFQTLMKLQDFHANPESPDMEISALLEAMMKCCEKFFRTHIHHVTRSKQWSKLPQEIQARILEVSAYVYLPETSTAKPSKQALPAANKRQTGKQERTLPLSISGARHRAAPSATTISAPARSSLATKTSPQSSRRGHQSHSESRMSRSISESLPSVRQKAGSSLQGVDAKVRASSRDRRTVRSSFHAHSLGGSSNVDDFSLFGQMSVSVGDESHGSFLPSARNFGYQPLSQIPRPGAYFMSDLELKKDDVTSEKVKVTEKVQDAEGEGSSQPLTNSLKLALSSQSKYGNGAKKLSPVGQRSHMISKLPTPIRSHRQPLKQQPSCIASSSHRETILLSTSRSCEMVSSEHLAASVSASHVSTCKVSQEDVASILPGGFDESVCHPPMTSPTVQPDSTSDNDLNPAVSDFLTQPSNSSEHLLDSLTKTTSPETCEHAHSDSQHLNTTDTVTSLDSRICTSEAILSEAILSGRPGKEQGHETSDVEDREAQAEVKIVHMSKTLNVGFIVPPD